MTKTPWIAAAAALAALLGSAAAQASDLRIRGVVQIGLPLPVLPHVEFVPVHPHPGWRDRDRDGVPDWRDGYDNRRHGRHHAPGWRVDRDRDGVPDWRDGYDNRRDWGPRPGWERRHPGWGDGGHDGRWHGHRIHPGGEPQRFDGLRR